MWIKLDNSITISDMTASADYTNLRRRQRPNHIFDMIATAACSDLRRRQRPNQISVMTPTAGMRIQRIHRDFKSSQEQFDSHEMMTALN